MKLFGNNQKHKHVESNAEKTGGKRRGDAENTRDLHAAYAAADAKLKKQSDKKKKRGKGWLIALIVLLALVVVGILWYKGWREPPDIGPGGIHTPDVP